MVKWHAEEQAAAAAVVAASAGTELPPGPGAGPKGSDKDLEAQSNPDGGGGTSGSDSAKLDQHVALPLPDVPGSEGAAKGGAGWEGAGERAREGSDGSTGVHVVELQPQDSAPLRGDPLEGLGEGQGGRGPRAV